MTLLEFAETSGKQDFYDSQTTKDDNHTVKTNLCFYGNATLLEYQAFDRMSLAVKQPPVSEEAKTLLFLKQ